MLLAVDVRPAPQDSTEGPARGRGQSKASGVAHSQAHGRRAVSPSAWPLYPTGDDLAHLSMRALIVGRGCDNATSLRPERCVQRRNPRRGLSGDSSRQCLPPLAMSGSRGSRVRCPQCQHEDMSHERSDGISSILLGCTVFALVGVLWAMRSLQAFAEPNFTDPESVSDWWAVVSFSLCGAPLPAGLALLVRLTQRGGRAPMSC